ncbi:MAG TPA: mitochondrial fission ELM1 family protein [Acetobacteraceae bacterium]
MTSEPWILSEAYAGLQSQALGLAEAAGWNPDIRVLAPRAPWRFLPARAWPAPLRVVADALRGELPPLSIACGGMGAAVGAALRGRGVAAVQIQDPRMDARRFDVIVAARHDEMTGPNVVVTRTALHRATRARLRAEGEHWRERFAALPRPLVAVLVGGSNGRFRLDAAVAARLAGELAAMMRVDRVGLALTPSRRTDPAAIRVLTDALTPLGAYVWDGSGGNPYFGMLALADAIVVTTDSVSMISEAVATTAPVLLAPLPGRSRRNGLFTAGLLADGRVRNFTGRLERWETQPMDDTADAAAEVRRRLGL